MINIPECYERNCKHLIGVKQSDNTEMTEVNVCKAFPDGIPFDIQDGENLHLEPVEGDHGIQYEEGEPEGE